MKIPSMVQSQMLCGLERELFHHACCPGSNKESLCPIQYNRTKVPHIGYQIHDFTGTGLVNAIVPTHGTLVSSIPWCKGEEKE